MVMDGTNGQNLFSYTEPSGNYFWGPAEISSGVMYVTNLDGYILAFAPGPPVATPEASLAILLPVVGVGTAGSVFAFRRRRAKALLASG